MLVATAEGARDGASRGARERGAQVELLHLYRTVSGPVDAEAVVASDLVTFTSSPRSQTWSSAAGGPCGVRAVSIGPYDRVAARARGGAGGEADPHDIEGLVEAVLRAAAIE